MKKDKDNAMIAGVCAGLADEYSVDVTMVRLGFAVATLMGFGLPVVVQSGTGAVSYVRNEFGLVFNFQDSSKGNLLELCT